MNIIEAWLSDLQQWLGAEMLTVPEVQHKLLQVVSEGGSGYFFEKEAEKICLVRKG